MGEVPLRLHPLTAHFATLRNTISISVAAAVIQEWNEAYFVHVRTELTWQLANTNILSSVERSPSPV